MAEILTRQEVNCLALYLSRNSWAIKDIAKLLDMSEQNVTERIYAAMELEGKLNIKNPIPCVLRDGTKLNYELDAEYYLGESYTKLYYANQTNIEQVANYIKTSGDDDIPTEILLHANEHTNSLWRNKIYKYTCSREKNRLEYERMCAKLKKIIAEGIDGFSVYNTDDDRTCGIDFIQERLCTGFKEVMEVVKTVNLYNVIIPNDYHDMNALAWSIRRNNVNIVDNPIAFSNINTLKSRLSTIEKTDEWDRVKGCEYERWPGYMFFFSTSLVNIIIKQVESSTSNFEYGITNGSFNLYDIYKHFKKYSGLGTQSLALIIWYYTYNKTYAGVVEQRRNRLIDIRDNEAKKLISMTIDDANAYLEENYGKKEG